MKLYVEIKNQVVVISITGEITSSQASQELIELVNNKLEKSNKNFVIDLGKVNYLNSAGINALITALTLIRNNGGELLLACLSNKVKSLLVVTKLNSIFKIMNSVNESIQSLNQMSDLETTQIK